MKINKIIYYFFILIAFASCNNDKNNDPVKIGYEKTFTTITSPGYGTIVKSGDTMVVSGKCENKEIKIDSMQISIDNVIISKVLKTDTISFIFCTKGAKVGTHTIQLETFYEDKSTEIRRSSFIINPSEIPIEYTYKVLNTYPHDITAYTQGLFLKDGILYESTGQYGESRLRKLEYKTGKELKSVSLSDDFFGEGSCAVDKSIFYLSWREMKGFIIDIEQFTIQSSFTYSSEGWGLTSNGEKLYMSDGSNIIYIRNKSNFSEIERLEVYDNQGPIKNLNELEYIDGKIYANVYLTDYVVIIDAITGSVIGKINFSGLLKESDKHEKIDVLNGIAYNPQNKNLLVTGKNWPKLFEISIAEIKK